MKALKTILSIGLAAGAGLAIGLLTAPRKGKHTRTRLKHGLEDAKDNLEDAANMKLDEARAILNETIQTRKSTVLDQLKNAKNSASKVKSKLAVPTKS
jgi:gas vesicle protein